MKQIFNESLSTASIIFLVSVLGFLLGKIKIKGISLGLSGILFIAVLYGSLIGCNILCEDSIPYGFLSTLGTAMFVPIIGIVSGKQLCHENRKKTFLSFCIGALSVIVSSVITVVIFRIDKSISLSSLLGLFAGALTSTPTLAAAKELANISLTELTAGYGLSYFFGVASVVLFVQVACKSGVQASSLENRKQEYSLVLSPGNTAFLTFSCSIIGQVLGRLPLPLLTTSFGASGGMLIVGIVTGFIYEKKKVSVSDDSMACIRTLGLTFFLVGAGVPAGIGFASNINSRYVFYSVTIAAFAIATSYLSTKKVLHLSKTDSLCTVCGSMTSTPAIGALGEKIEEANKSVSYTAAYTGALLSLIICVKIIYKVLT